MKYVQNSFKGIRSCRREPGCVHVLLRSLWWALLGIVPLCLVAVSMFGWWCASVSGVGENTALVPGAVADTRVSTELREVLSDMEKRSQHYDDMHTMPLQTKDPAPKSVTSPSNKTQSPKRGNDAPPVPII